MFKIWRRDGDGSGYEALRKAADADVDVLQAWVDDSYVIGVDVDEYRESAAEVETFVEKSPHEYAAAGEGEDVAIPDGWASNKCKIRVKKRGEGDWTDPELVGETDLDLVAIGLPRDEPPEWW